MLASQVGVIIALTHKETSHKFVYLDRRMHNLMISSQGEVLLAISITMSKPLSSLFASEFDCRSRSKERQPQPCLS